jgi:hypothetical protein
MTIAIKELVLVVLRKRGRREINGKGSSLHEGDIGLVLCEVTTAIDFLSFPSLPFSIPFIICFLLLTRGRWRALMCTVLNLQVP